MQKKLFIFPFFVIIMLLLLVSSCKPEDEEPRTREREWEELDAWMKRLEDEGQDIDTTDLLVFYTVLKAGEGPTPQNGDSCAVSYIGYKPSGAKFEDSRDIYKNGIWKFIYKPPHDVSGLIDGIGYMNEGAEFEMYIHSDFAYGSKGTTGIPPYTTLVYRVTMHEMIPKK